MKFGDGQSEFSRVFNLAIICYSRKLDAREKLVFYSSLRADQVISLNVSQYVQYCVPCPATLGREMYQTGTGKWHLMGIIEHF